MKTLFLTTLFCLTFMPFIGQAASRYYVASNIPVLIEGPTAPGTRDLALLKAQKLALGQFMAQAVPPVPSEKLAGLSDSTISRAMKDFSLQNERVLSQSYQANLTIRFDAVRFEGLLRSANLPLPAVKDIDLAHVTLPPPAEAVTADVTATPNATTTSPAMTPQQPTVLILPVLNIGSKIILWDEINAWRDAWQKQDAFKFSTTFSIPLGDLADLNDAPDTGFLNQKTKEQPGLENMLKRYQVQAVYLALAKAQAAKPGLTVKLYRYGNQTLTYKGTFDPSSRPGYLFNDAVLATANQIDKLEHGTVMATPAMASVPTLTASTAPSVPTMLKLPANYAASSTIVAVIPIPNLSAWISLQQQLRQTPGIANLVTQSISSNQAVVRIESKSTTPDLLRALQANGFTVQPINGNTYTITRQNG